MRCCGCLSQYKVKSFAFDRLDQCVICLHDIAPHDSIVLPTGCSHQAHKNCYVEMIFDNEVTKCPECQAHIHQVARPTSETIRFVKEKLKLARDIEQLLNGHPNVRKMIYMNFDIQTYKTSLANVHVHVLSLALSNRKNGIIYLEELREYYLVLRLLGSPRFFENVERMIRTLLHDTQAVASLEREICEHGNPFRRLLCNIVKDDFNDQTLSDNDFIALLQEQLF